MTNPKRRRRTPPKAHPRRYLLRQHAHTRLVTQVCCSRLLSQPKNRHLKCLGQTTPTHRTAASLQLSYPQPVCLPPCPPRSTQPSSRPVLKTQHNPHTTNHQHTHLPLSSLTVPKAAAVAIPADRPRTPPRWPRGRDCAVSFAGFRLSVCTRTQRVG